MTTTRTPSETGTTTAVPAATRVQSPGWRDPRVVVGVVIVAGCVLLGARVVGSADDTVSMWSARHDLPAGAALTRDDLRPVRVHLTGVAADRYLAATADPAPGSTVARDVEAGELLPRSAIRSEAGPALVEVPLSVAPDDVPSSVRQGATVDVWVLPKVAATDQGRSRARLALEDVVVVAVPATGDSLAPRTTQQVIVGVEQDRAGDLPDALGQIADGRVLLTRQAGS